MVKKGFKMLRRTYNWIMGYAASPRALWVLIAISFAESSFFPLPPDPLYMAMILSRKDQAWRLAFICTLSSVVGGLLGYAIGYTLYETLGTWIIEAYGMQNSFAKIQADFQKWGFWIVALKGLTPIPYKIVTIASGVARLNLGTFIAASIIARSFRFFLLAGLLKYYGPDIRIFVERNLTLVTTATVGALVTGFVVFKLIWA